MYLIFQARHAYAIASPEGSALCAWVFDAVPRQSFAELEVSHSLSSQQLRCGVEKLHNKSTDKE